MRKRISWLLTVALGVISLVAVACSQDESPQFPVGPPTPDAQATITALSQQAQAGPPTPTPVPAQVMRSTQSFAKSYQVITAGLDELHQDFDSWQTNLNACTQTSVQIDLQRFSGDFLAITQSARNLSRVSGFRHLADRLIQAAEAEERVLSQLRDKRQSNEISVTDDAATTMIDVSANKLEAPVDEYPAAPTEAMSPRSLSEQVDAARSSSSAVLRDVTDILVDLEDRQTPATRELLDDFLLAFQAANTMWDIYHEGYDSFRRQEATLTSDEIVTGLSDLVAKFREVMVAIRELPSIDATREIATLMDEAADAEDLALRNLRDTFQRSGDRRSTGVNGIVDLSGSLNKEAGFVAGDPSLFGTYGSQLVKSNTVRREASAAMDKIAKTFSEDDRIALATFDEDYQALLEQWNGFHQAYGEWSRTEGGCDRKDVIGTLSGFSLRASQIAASAGRLPSSNALRPLEEVLVEAVRREDASLKDLRDSWRPFDAGVYQKHNHQRLAAGKLTRHVGVGIQELLQQYDIDPG